MKINLNGLVIMEKVIGEKDKLLTILTDNQGIIRAFAKSAKNIKNKNSSGTQLFCYSQFIIYQNKEKFIIDEATPKELFFDLRYDIEKLALAQYFCELALALAPEGDKAGDFLRLMLNSIYYLVNHKMNIDLIKSIFEMRILCLAGYMPNLVGCNCCGTYESQKMHFLNDDAIIVCHECMTFPNQESVILTNSALFAIRHIIYSDFEKIFSFTVSKETEKVLSNACEKYLLFRLGRSFKTLDFFKKLKI